MLVLLLPGAAAAACAVLVLHLYCAAAVLQLCCSVPQSLAGLECLLTACQAPHYYGSCPAACKPVEAAAAAAAHLA
jgi:hypothetical protein